MGRADELEAELEVVRLEEELAKAKATKKGASRDLKLEVREARQRYRESRTAVTGEGDATVTPDVIGAKAEAN